MLESQLPEQAGFAERRYDLSAFGGDVIQLRFGFDTVDDNANNFEGFYVDDATILAPGGPVCGNGLVAASCGEICDDGNGLDGDGCSASCELEGVTDQRTFSGTAQGGSIELTVSGIELSVPTSAGESSAAVAAAVAAAINASAELQGLGVTAVSSLEQLFVIGGTIASAVSSDPGIAILGLPTIPALSSGGRIALALLLVATVLIASSQIRARAPRRPALGRG